MMVDGPYPDGAPSFQVSLTPGVYAPVADICIGDVKRRFAERRAHELSLS